MTATDSVVLRPLRAEDLELLFNRPGNRGLGKDWLVKQERGDVYVAVAEVNGVPVGRACLDFTSYAEQRTGYLLAAGVRPEWRSRGIGTMIHRHLEQVALSRGFRALRSIAEKTNPRAARWHERLGYRRIGDGLVRWTESDGRDVEVDCWKFERPLGSMTVPEPPKT